MAGPAVPTVNYKAFLNVKIYSCIVIFGYVFLEVLYKLFHTVNRFWI